MGVVAFLHAVYGCCERRARVWNVDDLSTMSRFAWSDLGQRGGLYGSTSRRAHILTHSRVHTRIYQQNSRSQLEIMAFADALNVIPKQLTVNPAKRIHPQASKQTPQTHTTSTHTARAHYASDI